MHCSVCPMVCAGFCGAFQVRVISPLGPSHPCLSWKDMLPWQGNRGQSLTEVMQTMQSCNHTGLCATSLPPPTHPPSSINSLPPHSPAQQQARRSEGKSAGLELRGGRSSLALHTSQLTPRACWCPQSNCPGNQICQNLVQFVRSMVENKSMGFKH